MDSDDYSDDFEKPADGYEPFSAEAHSVATKETHDSAPSPTAAHRTTHSQDVLVSAGEDEEEDYRMEEIERVSSLDVLAQESIGNPYHLLRKIQKDNTDLRAQLRHINDQLDTILERKATKAPIAPKTSAATQSRSSEQQLRTAQKKLDTVKKERDKVYDKLQRLVDPSYSASLAQDVDDLRRKLDRLQRQNRSKSQGQRGREKNLERFSQEDELSSAMKVIIEEKSSIKVLHEKIANIEEDIERIAGTLLNLEEREQVLKGKHQELKAEASVLGVSISSEGKRKKQLETLLAAKEACKREIGVSILSSDTQVKKLKRKESELLSELQSKKDELNLLEVSLQGKTHAVHDTNRQLIELTDLTAGTDAEYLATKALRRVRTKSREISVPLEDNLPRSTKSSEPGSRDPRHELLNLRVRPAQNQSSKSLIAQSTAPKPPRPIVLPRSIVKSEDLNPMEIALKSDRKQQIDEEKETRTGQRAETVPLSNPYQAAMETMKPPLEETNPPPVEPIHPPPRDAEPTNPTSGPLFAPSMRPDSRSSENDSQTRDLPPVRPPFPRDRSHLIIHEEMQSVPAPPLGLLERKALRQRSRPSEGTPSRAEELARKAEEKHAFFDHEESGGFTEVQKQLVAIRSEGIEEKTQQIVVQYKLQPHQALEEEDLV